MEANSGGSGQRTNGTINWLISNRRHPRGRKGSCGGGCGNGVGGSACGVYISTCTACGVASAARGPTMRRKFMLIFRFFGGASCFVTPSISRRTDAVSTCAWSWR